MSKFKAYRSSFINKNAFYVYDFYNKKATLFNVQHWIAIWESR